jgi:hypothetical protein
VLPELSNSLSAGLNIKFIQQNIENHTAQTVAIDIGTLYKTPIKNLSTGLVIQNLGPQMKFVSHPYDLPLTIGAGLGYNLGAITLVADIKQQIYEGKTTIAFGTEYWPVNMLAVRAGYAGKLIEATLTNKDIITQNNTDNTNFTGFGAGLGLKLFTNYQMDYSFVPYGVLGDTHRINFSAKF